jgi:hypothetical protein
MGLSYSTRYTLGARCGARLRSSAGDQASLIAAAASRICDRFGVNEHELGSRSMPSSSLSSVIRFASRMPRLSPVGVFVLLGLVSGSASDSDVDRSSSPPWARSAVFVLSLTVDRDAGVVREINYSLVARKTACRGTAVSDLSFTIPLSTRPRLCLPIVPSLREDLSQPIFLSRFLFVLGAKVPAQHSPASPRAAHAVQSRVKASATFL